MKTITICLGIIFFCGVGINAQQNKILKAPVRNTVVHVATAPEKPANAKKPAQAPAVNVDVSSASVSFTTGDDGKDKDTQIGMALWSKNHDAAANYNMVNGNVFNRGIGNAAEYFTGSTVTVPMQVEASVATGEIKMVGSLPLPVLRMATPSDFKDGGEVRINIAPNGHDTWKIRTIVLHLTFNNDPNSPHTISWNNVTLSQDSRYADLLFDGNFTALQ